MDSGGKTPEELETLLEDALLLSDPQAVARLFDDGSILITADGALRLCGRDDTLRFAAMLCEKGQCYLADPRSVFQARDTALLIGDGIINVARRSHDGSWRFAIALLPL